MDASPETAPSRSLKDLRRHPRVAPILSRLHDLFVLPLRKANGLVRGISSASHHFQYKVEGFLRPSAEWFDHEIDVHWQWPARGRATFLERGVLNTLGIPPGADVLELCCGDGFNTGRFYAPLASRVVAIDHNESALKHARKRHMRPNVEYLRGDVLGELPAGPFDNVIFDAAIHHFTPEEAAQVLESVHGVLRGDGLLSGYTVIEPGNDYSYQRNHFEDPESLARLLSAQFAHVALIETHDPARRNLYFYASDEPKRLPFPEGVNQPPVRRPAD